MIMGWPYLQACFDIREAPVVWAKMRLIEEDDISMEWLSTHPSHEKRQAQLSEMLPAALSVRETCKVAYSIKK